ncbi:hypothetical protein Agub_g3290 [Astrephomene gubernaculifera]|uniref:Uncharacterized protein n=1 Tax=Astrephomene gubernaculifera TaxID=47775 RepID=A0AAD3DIJ1_9CHLO|nr:hypothetical protein Agub_g3290 [Astrephomene gubernaculifera]
MVTKAIRRFADSTAANNHAPGQDAPPGHEGLGAPHQWHQPVRGPPAAHASPASRGSFPGRQQDGGDPRPHVASCHPLPPRPGGHGGCPQLFKEPVMQQLVEAMSRAPHARGPNHGGTSQPPQPPAQPQYQYQAPPPQQHQYGGAHQAWRQGREDPMEPIRAAAAASRLGRMSDQQLRQELTVRNICLARQGCAPRVQLNAHPPGPAGGGTKPGPPPPAAWPAQPPPQAGGQPASGRFPAGPPPGAGAASAGFQACRSPDHELWRHGRVSATNAEG